MRKFCHKCNQTEEFGLDRTRKNGLQHACKVCCRRYSDAYRKTNPEKVRISKLRYQKRKFATDPIFKMKENLRCLIRFSLKNKGFSKKTKTCEIVGTDYETLHRHLLDGFLKVYGRLPNDQDVLSVDHIIPLITATTEEEVLRLNNYTNLRFLLKKDNEDKNDKLNWALAKTEG